MPDAAHRQQSAPAQCVGPLNARCLPGVVTAVLAARLTCYALPWEDWMRVRSGQARRPLSPDRLPQEPSDEDFGDSVVIHRSPIGLVLPSEREGAKVAMV